MPMNLAISKSAIPYTWPSRVRAKTNRSPWACRQDSNIKEPNISRAPVANAANQPNRRLSSPPQMATTTFMRANSKRHIVRGPRLHLFERHGGLLRATQLGRGLQATAVHFPKLFREPHPTNVVVMRLAADHGSIVTARLLGSIGDENANGIHAPLERRASHMPDRRPSTHISPVDEGLAE